MDKQILTKPKMNNIEVFNLLKRLGIRTSSVGIKYILSVIRIGRFSNDYKLQMEDIYIQVAKIYNVSPLSIKSGIKYSLDHRNISISQKNFESIFGYEYDEYLFINKEFIEEVLRIISIES